MDAKDRTRTESRRRSKVARDALIARLREIEDGNPDPGELTRIRRLIAQADRAARGAA